MKSVKLPYLHERKQVLKQLRTDLYQENRVKKIKVL